ncbi:MAG TPA: PorV/PorQ family protein [Bacteroidia bacterium]|nr:PorV/PorQ family protein [Bacteroidia bacterium]HNU32685.1 PorV/PorQ family protein [Bacteroidia bacterium]
MYRFTILFLLTLNINYATAQWDYGFLSEYFFGRKPNVRSQAMGGCYPAFQTESSVVYYNPAGLQIKKKEIAFQSSYSSPYYILDDAKYIFSGIAYGLNEKFSIGFTFNHFNVGDISFGDADGNVIGYFNPIRHNFALSLNYKLPLGIALGVNGNYFGVSEKVIPDAYTMLADIGLEKKIDMVKTKSQQHRICFATALFNFAKSSITYEYPYSNSKTDHELPQICNFSASYNFDLMNVNDSTGLKSHRITFSSQFEDVLNSEFKTSIRLGVEYLFYKMIALRAGWFNTTEYDYGSPEINKSNLKEFTYGLGFILPLDLLTKNKTPFCFKFDFVNLKQNSLSNPFPFKMKNYNGFSLSINYQFK